MGKLVLFLLLPFLVFAEANQNYESYVFEKGSKPALHFGKARVDSSMAVTWCTFRDRDPQDFVYQNWSIEDADISAWSGVNGSVAQSSALSYDGSYSLKLTASADSSFAVLTIFPDTTVMNLFQCYAMVASDADSIRVGVATSENWSDVLLTPSLVMGDTLMYDSQVATGSWQSFVFDFYNYEIHTSNMYDSLFVLIGNVGGMSGTVTYIDSLNIVESQGTPIYTNGVVKYWKDGVPGTVYTDSIAIYHPFHVHRLTGLSPDTKYYYYVRSDTVGGTYYQSETYSFTTQPAPHSFYEFKFAVVGHERNGSYHYKARDRVGKEPGSYTIKTSVEGMIYWDDVIDSLTANHADEIEFMISPGDFVPILEQVRLRRMFHVCDTLTAYTPTMLSSGDHETSTSYGPAYGGYDATENDLISYLKQWFPVSDDAGNMANSAYTSGNAYRDSLCWFFDVGTVRFVIFHHLVTGNSGFNQWYENEVIGNLPSSIDWVVVVNQKCIESASNPNRDRPEILADLGEKFSLYIGGNVINYETISIGQGRFQLLQANSGTGCLGTSSSDWDFIDRRLEQPTKPVGYAIVTVKEDRLVIDEYCAYDTGGSGFTGKFRTFEIHETIRGSGFYNEN